MSNLTAQQVKELADNLLRMTNALGNYRYENYDGLTEEENLQIKELHNKQLQHVTELYTQSAVLVLNEASTTLDEIDDITKDTLALYENLGTVQVVLDRATSILTLASAIIGLNAEGISSSIKSLLAAVS